MKARVKVKKNERATVKSFKFILFILALIDYIF